MDNAISTIRAFGEPCHRQFVSRLGPPIWWVLWLCLILAGRVEGAILADPEVDRFNVRVGTQTFGPKYHFTTNTTLVETAEAIQALGSDVIKFHFGRGFGGQYGISVPGSITDLRAMAQSEPSCRRVLDMPLRHYVIWVYCFASTSDAWWKDGFSTTERQKEYDEIFSFTRYLLTQYSGSGKSFYLGHWEGDWYLLNNYDASGNPSATALQGMIDWLNTRQQAVDDALRLTPHSNVNVFTYTEVNRVRDAMVNGAASNQRLVNKVLPYVTNLDFVSWSSYDGMNLGATDLIATLNYIEAHLPTNKAPAIAGRRVIIGEYGWGGSLSSAAQEAPTRAYLQKLLSWSPRFILFWEMYDNESKAYWLIDSAGEKTPCYWLHHRLINEARLRVARFKESQARLPDDAEFATLLTPLLNQPLPVPVPIVCSNRGLAGLSATSAVVQGTIAQGLYGDEAAQVTVFWGRQDGGTNRVAWEESRWVGLNTNFNPSTFSAMLTNLAPRTNYFYRFYATNANGEAWTPSAATFSTAVLNPQEFGSRLKITFTGYTRGEPLQDFPALVVLNTNLPGFRYGQFASPTGGDLRFTDATGTQLIAHEIDEWNTNGNSLIWVRVPWLGGTNDAVWAYWGNSAAAAEPAATNGAAWSPTHELVWHLKETAFPYKDSSLKHPASNGDAPTPTSAGIVGRGGAFNGTTDYLNAGVVNLGSQFTLSAWAKVDGSLSDIQTLWANKAGGSAANGLALFVNSWHSSDGKLILETGNGTGGITVGTPIDAVSFGQWHHLAAAIDRAVGTARLFVDGVDRTGLVSVRSDFANQSPLSLGRFTDNNYRFKGTLDEVRVVLGARSENWMWASWQTVASNSSWASYSPITTVQPTLQVAWASETNLLFRWPAGALGFALYASTNLIPPAFWMRVATTPALRDNQWLVELPVSTEESRYYRLQGD